MENYPPDWPCKCGHERKYHGMLRTHRELKNLCMVQNPDGKLAMLGYIAYVDNCNGFAPVDNLTYVEKLADARTTSL